MIYDKLLYEMMYNDMINIHGILNTHPSRVWLDSRGDLNEWSNTRCSPYNLILDMIYSTIKASL